MVKVEQIGEYTGHRGSIFAMVVDADEHLAYSSGDDGVVARWNLRGTPDLGEAVMKAGNAIYALALAEDLSYLAAGGSDGTVFIVDLKSNDIVHTYRKTEGSVYGLYYEPHSQLLWILHAMGAFSVLHLGTFEERGYQRIAENHLRSFEVDPETGYFFIGSSDHHIYCFDRQAAKIIRKWKAHDNSVFALKLHPAGKYLLSGGRDAYLNVWDLQHPELEAAQRIPAHNFTLNDIALSPNGDYLITASRDKTLKLWDAYQFDLLKVIDFTRHEGHKHSVNRVIWLNRDNSVVSCSDDRRILRWKITVEKR